MNDKDKYNIWVDAYICSFHIEKPGEDFAGCSCSSAFGMHPKNPQEFYDQNKEDFILDELLFKGS